MDVPEDWWKSLFDELYLITDARSVCDPQLTRKEAELILDFLPWKEGDSVVDLCGGQGRHAMELARRAGLRVTVLDYSAALIAEGQKSAAGFSLPVKFLRADARRTGLASQSFDHAIIMGNSLGYLPRPEDDLEILAEAFRILRPRGSLLVDVSNGPAVKESLPPRTWHEAGEDIIVLRERELRGDLVVARELAVHKKRGLLRETRYAIRLYSPSGLAALLESAGFSEVEVISDFASRSPDEDYGCMNKRMLGIAKKP